VALLVEHESIGMYNQYMGSVQSCALV
jgi:hypothetical protein